MFNMIVFSDIANSGQSDNMLRHSAYCNESMVKQTVAIAKNTFNIFLKIADYLRGYLLYLR